MSAIRITLGQQCMVLNHKLNAFKSEDQQLAPLIQQLQDELSEMQGICEGRLDIEDTQLGRSALSLPEDEDDATEERTDI